MNTTLTPTASDAAAAIAHYTATAATLRSELRDQRKVAYDKTGQAVDTGDFTDEGHALLDRIRYLDTLSAAWQEYLDRLTATLPGCDHLTDKVARYYDENGGTA